MLTTIADDLFRSLYGWDVNVYAQPVNVNKDTHELTYEFEIPGFKKEEVTVNVSPSKLEILADGKRGKVRKSLSWGFKVDVETATMTLEDGILTVKVGSVKPKALNSRKLSF